MLSLRNNLPVQENVFGWNSDDARTYARNIMNSCPGKLEDMKKSKKKILKTAFFEFFFLHFIPTYFTDVFTHTALVSAATCFSIL